MSSLGDLNVPAYLSVAKIAKATGKNEKTVRRHLTKSGRLIRIGEGQRTLRIATKDLQTVEPEWHQDVCAFYSKNSPRSIGPFTLRQLAAITGTPYSTVRRRVLVQKLCEFERTPTGRIIVRFESLFAVQFDAEGREIGLSGWIRSIELHFSPTETE